MATLAGLGVGGAVGGVAGALIGLGIPEYEAKLNQRSLKKGGILISVHCNTSAEITSAKDLLKGSGAADISSAGEPAAAPTVMQRRATGSGEALHETIGPSKDWDAVEARAHNFHICLGLLRLGRNFARASSTRAHGPGWHLSRRTRN